MVDSEDITLEKIITQELSLETNTLSDTLIVFSYKEPFFIYRLSSTLINLSFRVRRSVKDTPQPPTIDTNSDVSISTVVLLSL